MYEPSPPPMGFWRMFLVAFVPCTVFAHLWAYHQLPDPQKASYVAIAGATYLVPLAGSALVAVVARLLRRAARRRLR